VEAAARAKAEMAANASPRHRAELVALAQRHGAVLASHDDSTAEEVAESAADGVALAEFPTTVEAARACRAAGITVMMGAPNLIRGGSHSGNVAAVELARHGLLDMLSSDYVPAALLLAAFRLPALVPGLSLARAVATVTANPARAVGLLDRGELAVGRRADLVRVHLAGEQPVVRETWRGGRRVA
jgi:alpha-D-ribose 1-methylphosphonate 5-triphosphate diphosphatase